MSVVAGWIYTYGANLINCCLMWLAKFTTKFALLVLFIFFSESFNRNYQNQVYFNEVSFAQKLKPYFFSKLKHLWCHANIFERKFSVHIWCHHFLLGKFDKDTIKSCTYGAVAHIQWCRRTYGDVTHMMPFNHWKIVSWSAFKSSVGQCLL